MARAHGSARRTALASLVAAGALVALKLGTGLATGSLALVSAGVESSGDVIAALFTLFAVRVGMRPADEDHQYGHRRAENLAALGEAALIAGGATVITFEAARRLASGGETLDVRWYVFAVVAVALCIDVSRIVISLRAAERYESAAFRSNAFNFAGDLAGSLAVLFGLALVAGGVQDGDAIAALAVAGFIYFAAARLVLENVSALMDTAPGGARRDAQEALWALEPPVELRRLRMRESAGRIYADVTVGLPPAAAVVESHDAADRVEDALRDALPGSDVVVHVEPSDRDVTLRERVLAAALADPDVREAHDIAIFERGRRAAVSLHIKLPDTLSLAQAHEVAERVERTICSIERVERAQTHIEPLERPLATDAAPTDDSHERRALLAEVVKRELGRPARAIDLVPTDAGVILFLTVALPATLPLADAHAVAGRLEEAIRAEDPGLAEVVVHTEPDAAPQRGAAAPKSL